MESKSTESIQTQQEQITQLLFRLIESLKEIERLEEENATLRSLAGERMQGRRDLGMV
jgi:hypothetical protein